MGKTRTIVFPQEQITRPLPELQPWSPLGYPSLTIEVLGEPSRQLIPAVLKHLAHADLTSESTKLAAAEEKNSRIPKLESDLMEKDRRLDTLNTEATTLKSAQAEPVHPNLLRSRLKLDRRAVDDPVSQHLKIGG
jgi:hypothetical protein